MNVFLSLNGHANSVCLPLRLGVRITAPRQQFAHLESARIDEAGSRSQRQNEIDEGRKHFAGTLVIPHESTSEGVPYKLPCRIVLGPPSRSDQRPPVITVWFDTVEKYRSPRSRHPRPRYVEAKSVCIVALGRNVEFTKPTLALVGIVSRSSHEANGPVWVS
jgi:hypothetical protein